jgi:hypothetical protein
MKPTRIAQITTMKPAVFLELVFLLLWGAEVAPFPRVPLSLRAVAPV